MTPAKWALLVLTGLGVFATIGTLAGFVLEKNLTGYAWAAALGYLLSTVGFLFLVGWTYCKGHLEDVEAPKHKVLSAENDDAE